jgi:hypothetical protein
LDKSAISSDLEYIVKHHKWWKKEIEEEIKFSFIFCDWLGEIEESAKRSF